MKVEIWSAESVCPTLDFGLRRFDYHARLTDGPITIGMMFDAVSSGLVVLKPQSLFTDMADVFTTPLRRTE